MLVHKESIVGQLCLCGVLLTKPPVSYGPSPGAVKGLLTALGNTLQDGGMGTGTCQCNGQATGEVILCPLSSVTLQGKLCCCVHWTLYSKLCGHNSDISCCHGQHTITLLHVLMKDRKCIYNITLLPFSHVEKYRISDNQEENFILIGRY